MAWHVALVLDDITDPAGLLSMMPVWAKSNAERRDSAPGLRTQWSETWQPDPSLTLIDTDVSGDPAEIVADLIPTLEDHHYGLTCVRLFGVENTDGLRRRLSVFQYHPLSKSSYPGLAFARPISLLEQIPVLELDARNWAEWNDMYDAFFAAVHAPGWHGRNFNALNDSISSGGLHGLAVPSRLVVQNTSKAGSNAQEMISAFSDLIREINSEGCPVEMELLD